jgi:hypothetical protein
VIKFTCNSLVCELGAHSPDLPLEGLIADKFVAQNGIFVIVQEKSECAGVNYDSASFTTETEISN